MSSRNAYLTPKERKQAPILFQTIKEAKRIVRSSPERSIRTEEIQNILKAQIRKKQLAKLDYIAFFNPDTLRPLEVVERGSHMALAVYFGKTRLIDNARL
jgi:pantoate--beta-alanine ligase